MKYLYSWLKEHYAHIPPLNELENVLIQLGHDVEKIEPVTYDGLVIAEILEIEKHPNADKLSLVVINDGQQTLKVVCGAPGLKVGQKAVYAPVGVTLPCGITLKQATIRGVESAGMLCAADELGISSSHESLFSIADEAEVGATAHKYLPEDAVISIDVTSDRGDVLSHFGLARDIKSLCEQEVLKPTFRTVTYSGKTSEQVSIGSIHPDARALSLGIVEGTGDKPARTPLWMAARLTYVGLKSINLATDITNYLLYEYGQPLHAYDANKLPERKDYTVRRSHDGERFQGLNNKPYTLTPQSLVVAVDDKPVALAGVLGGEDSKVGSNTQQVIFESAHFYPKPIRIMARGLNTLTDSALHWERGVDFGLMEPVLKHAQALFCELSGGTAYEPLVKENPGVNEQPVQTKLMVSEAERVIGSPVTRHQIEKILTSLGCTVTDSTDEVITVTPPTWRLDLAIVEDYYEEIVRMIGLQNLTKKPLPASVPQWKRSKYWRVEQLKDELVSLGANEIMTYPFINQRELELFTPNETPVELRDAPIEDKQLLRTSLIPGMLQAIASNPESPSIYLFEVAKIYTEKEETEMICIGTAGNNSAELDSWWQNLFERERLPVGSWMSRVKTMSDEICNFYKIRKSSVQVLHLPISDLINNKQHESPTVRVPDLESITYTPTSKFQASRRDIAIVVDQSHEPDTISQSLRELDPTIVAVELFDTYTDTKLGENKQSLAYRIMYQANDHTLTGDEINELHSKVEAFVKEQYDASIR